MAIAISARDLYDKWKNAYLKKQLPENEIPPFSWFNPAEKINCLLSIGLYGIGCMGQQIHFLKKVCQDVQVLVMYTS